MSTIAVVVPPGDNWFFNQVVAGARQRAAEAGHDVVQPDTSGAAEVGTSAVPDVIEAAFADPDVVGAVVAAFQHWGDDRDRALSWTRPIVVVGGSVLGFPVVSVDDIGVAREVTQHLLHLGHRRITHLTGPLDHDSGFLFMARRAKGFRVTVESAGLDPVVVETRLDREAVRTAIRGILGDQDRPTAIFAVNDQMAFAVLEVAAELGIEIGHELSVAGVNDHPRAEQEGLTTVRQHPDEVGATAVEMVLEALDEPGKRVRSRLHPAALVPRGSTSVPYRH